MTSARSVRNPRLESLRNILRLERSRGCPDTSVFGGVDRFLQRLLQEKDNPQVQQLRELGMLNVSYGQLLPARRDAWAAEVMRLLELGQARGASRKSSGKTSSSARGTSGSPSPGVGSQVALESPITALRSVNSRSASLLRRLGVGTVGDLLYLFPHRHNDFSQVRKIRDLQIGQEQTVAGQVWEARVVTLGRFRKATEAVVGDDTGNIRVVWFNQPYLANTFKPNTRLALSGNVTLFKGRKVFESPEYEVLEKADGADLVHTGRLVPVYPGTEGLSPRTIRRAVREALDHGLPLLQEFLPQSLLKRAGLVELSRAMHQAHYPDSEASKEAARHRLAFDELFLMQMAVLRHRKAMEGIIRSVPLKADPRVLQSFLASLPFSLTSAQQRVLGEILADVERANRPMSRLLQGEVGSGKTVVALAALLVAATNDHMGVFMVPTELLAEQHFLTVSRLLRGLARPGSNGTWLSTYVTPFPRPVSVGLLTGSMTAKTKKEMHQLISQGAIDILIGTHALLQGGVEMPRLALAVTDEQHRFGVAQRATLREKGESPHVLVMSATPIPRTLALTLFGDLDISTLDELPGDRQPITTRRVPPEKREAAYDFTRKQVRQGRQAFVICPLIQESEAVQARAATQEYHRLSDKVFPDLRLGLLHGRMPFKEKQVVMERFSKGEVDILVSTPVVEVGIDVPNASVMLIEGADRFGLAQLHQFRGRVGRGQHRSYCLMLAESPSQEAQERLATVEGCNDGFALAEADLRFRGPGDYFGTRQSGLPNLRVARLSDQELLAQARQEAQRLLDQDPGLQQHPALLQEMRRYLGEVVGEVS